MCSLNVLGRTHVVYRDGGLWTLLWLAVWSLLRNGHERSFKRSGYRGLDSESSAAIETKKHRVALIQMHPIASIRGVQVWRLTLELVTSQVLTTMSFGDGLVLDGRSVRADGGEETSPTRTPTNGTILT